MDHAPDLSLTSSQEPTSAASKEYILETTPHHENSHYP